MNKHAALIQFIENSWPNSDVLDAWNERCSEEDMDDYIYANRYVSELFEGSTAVDDALRAAYYGDYRYGDEYVKFDAYGNLESFDEYDIMKYVDSGILADYLEENGDANTPKVDNEFLAEQFVEQIVELFPYMKTGCAESLMIEIMDSYDPYDLLMDDWDDLAEDFKKQYDNSTETE